MSSFVTKTIDDAVAEARNLLNDTAAFGQPYRFTTVTLIGLLNTALREVYTLRPDAFIGNFTQGVLSNNAVVTYVVGDLGLNPLVAFPIDDRIFFAPVVAYIAGKAELADDEFVDSNRAMSLLGAFRAQLTGKG